MEEPARPATASMDTPLNQLAGPQQEPPDSKKPPNALTPPTSEDMNKHDDGSSELSELDMDDEEDIGEIVPDHYFEGGKVPVFKPVSHISSRTPCRMRTLRRWRQETRSMSSRINTLTYAIKIADHGPVPQLRKVCGEDR
jgi:hypothetical protein